MIVQNVSHDGHDGHVVHGAARGPARACRACWTRSPTRSGADRFEVDDDIAKLSLVGAGMKSHPGVAADMFDVLASEAINIEMISTSPIRVSCVIRRADGDRALRAVHTRFGLNAES